jgi:hypothetical protein
MSFDRLFRREGGSSVRRSIHHVALVAALALALPTLALANSGGIFDQAEAGCTCHGIVANAPSTRLFILGLPTGTDPLGPSGYVPLRSYDIQVIVIGVAEPAPQAAGFNILPSAGDLQSVDGTTRVRHSTECTRMQSETGCTPGFALNDCTIVNDTGCPAPDWDINDPDCHKCPSTPPPAGCRSCDATTVIDVQATHSAPKLLTWSLRWIAPPAGTGDVTFHLAGNVVNGNGGNDVGDLWSTLGSDPLQPLITVPEGETPGLLPELPLP